MRYDKAQERDGGDMKLQLLMVDEQVVLKEELKEPMGHKPHAFLANC